MGPLRNARYEHFAQLLAGGASASKAYVSAGYSERGAAQSAARLLRSAKVRSRVEELKQAVTERAVEKAAVDRAWVLEHLRQNVDRSMQAVPVTDREGNETGEYTYQGSVANRALELVGKELGMFHERVEHSGADGAPIQVQAGPVDYQYATTEELEAVKSIMQAVLARQAAEGLKPEGGTQ